MIFTCTSLTTSIQTACRYWEVRFNYSIQLKISISTHHTVTNRERTNTKHTVKNNHSLTMASKQDEQREEGGSASDHRSSLPMRCCSRLTSILQKKKEKKTMPWLHLNQKVPTTRQIVRLLWAFAPRKTLEKALGKLFTNAKTPSSSSLLTILAHQRERVARTLIEITCHGSVERARSLNKFRFVFCRYVHSHHRHAGPLRVLHLAQFINLVWWWWSVSHFPANQVKQMSD